MVRIDDNSWSPSLQGYSSGAVFAIKTAGLDANGIPMFWRDGKKISLQSSSVSAWKPATPGDWEFRNISNTVRR